MFDSFKFHQPVCRTVNSTAAQAAERHSRAGASQLAAPPSQPYRRHVSRLAWLAIGAFLTAQPLAALAGNAGITDEANEVRWCSPTRQQTAVTRGVVAGGARLKWKRSATKPRAFIADGAAKAANEPGPMLEAAQGGTVPNGASSEPNSVKLTSFNEAAEDPALDPFQDEVLDDEAEPAERDVPLASEETDFDADEVAQRGPLDLPEELRQQMSDEGQLPSLDNEYAQAPSEPERCPSPRDLKPINQISHRIAAEPGLFPQECALSDYPFEPRNFKVVTLTWKASALCHKPLYFQQAKLERYGHTFGPVLTPIISMAHFFVMVPCLPYNMGLEPPWECVYPLGWYRPGDCAPYTLGPLPLSLRGAATQGVITTGLWFLFP